MDETMTTTEPQGMFSGSIFLAPFELAAHGLDTLAGVFSGGQAAVVTVATGAQDTVGGIFEDAADTAQHATDTAGASLNPLNLFGAAAGFTITSAVVVVGLGVITAGVADELFAGGSGRRQLTRRITGSR